MFWKVQKNNLWKGVKSHIYINYTLLKLIGLTYSLGISTYKVEQNAGFLLFLFRNIILHGLRFGHLQLYGP